MKSTDAPPSPTAPPPGQAEGKREQVAAMFDRIAPRYDLLNRTLSLGIDVRWRKRAIRILADRLTAPPERLLDVATGTADLAIAAHEALTPAETIGVDPSEGMLAYGREKVTERGLDGAVRLDVGASEALPYPDAHFDGALVAFGVRNFEHLRNGLHEIRRVLRPNSPLVVLEFSRPRTPGLRQAYQFYFTQVLPRIGRTVSGDAGAYTYLPDSVRVFPDGDDFLREMRETGYRDLHVEPLTFGIASLYAGRA
ncbi:MAG: bifunctional demethylmenaquinone methyltransferase/2-methoxy-6-polyprenyl-1,4-benzoquinol methylase UbiE [Bacteroidota bacterium]